MKFNKKAPFKRAAFSWLLLFSLVFITGCAREKIVSPELKDFSVKEVRLNNQGKIELRIDLKVFNPNNIDFPLTVKGLNVFKEEKLIGSLVGEKKFNLLKKETSDVSFDIVIEDRNIIKTIYNFLISKKIVFTFKGNLVYHHSLGNFPFEFEREKAINIQDILF